MYAGGACMRGNHEIRVRAQRPLGRQLKCPGTERRQDASVRRDAAGVELVDDGWRHGSAGFPHSG